MVGGSVFYSLRSHFERAEGYHAKSEWKLAIREYDSAMHMYIPGSSYIQRSAERLWSIGERFEKEGRPDWANIAYASIRSSFYASRSLYTPGKDWIIRCDAKIADLDVKMLIKEGSISPEDAAAEKEKLLYVMTVDRAPDPVWSVVLEASLFAWISSAIFTILKGFDDKGALSRKSFVLGMLSFVITFTVWIASLLKA